MTDREQSRGQPEQRNLWLVSDFNLANLASVLRAAPGSPSVRPEVAPFGNVVQALMGFTDGQNEAGALVWTQPQSVLPSFQGVLEHRQVDRERLCDEVDSYCKVLQDAARRFRFLLVPTWVTPGGRRGLGMLDFQSDAGIAGAVLAINARLVANLGEAAGVFVLDGGRWACKGDPDESGRLWYLAKMPFGNDVFRLAAEDIHAALAGLHGHARKVVVVDLDDTLWGGIVGEVGMTGLRLGGHDPIGEAHVDFQQALKALTNRGVILAIASKNEESVAMEAIENHPEMALRRNDFAAWRINWDDKARNIAELAQELNVGVDSLVFLDDSPGERARVREALPAVLVPEWPKDPLRYAATLRRLTCFDASTLSDEDAARTRMYATERVRRTEREAVGSVEEWLETLEIRVFVSPLDEGNLQRSTQLLNKTNQMNLSTRRLTENELLGWASEAHRSFWTLRVADRFGDYGLTGLVGVEKDGKDCRIVDFVLSCRVFGRKVEQAMAHIAAEHARDRGLVTIFADYVETPKNKPCLDFWRGQSGFTEQTETGRFHRTLDEAYPLPDCLELLTEAAHT